SRIIGGQEARAAEFPWQAAVYVDTANGKYFCGGSLISEQWILTAAHCLYNGRLYTIQLGSTTLQMGDPNRVVLASSTAVFYPGFNTTTLENDIGLIKLHMPITFTGISECEFNYIQPIELATVGEIIEGTVATVTGWGQIDDATSGIVNDLYYVSVVVISNEECQITYGNQIKTTMICTLGNYNEGICTGDTGGALIATTGFNKYIQIGVSSFFSQQGCESLHPSGYTRTDLYNEWIKNVTQTV
ncbi:Trypsin domain containing protein, partial [Asbolus verrucosus]